jgi:uncharacterized protein YjiS (DUF1127 family)
VERQTCRSSGTDHWPVNIDKEAGRSADHMWSDGGKKIMGASECAGTLRRAFPAKAVEAVIGLVKAILKGLRRWYAADAAFRQLQSLSEEQLKDIGLHRSQIHYLVRDMAASRNGGHHAGD